ncbi:MAG: zf-HC2 domain-containing protein, partial [Candidatus Obscuribacterales bacterium]|nr:zf-HC2 domain-containing protein [Candidatus Obscuribacterales bacterium]
MNCSDFRYLIQQRFDEELNGNDAGSVDEHIDDCESCARFDHQLEQMIQGAEEASMPEELAPPNPEALAKLVQQQLPQQKGNFLSMIAGMFQPTTKPEPKKKGKGKGTKSKGSSTSFPHRNKSAKSAKNDPAEGRDKEQDEAM